MENNTFEKILVGCGLIIIAIPTLMVVISFGDAVINNPQGLLRITLPLGCIGAVIGGVVGFSETHASGERLRQLLKFALLGGLIGCCIGAFLVAIVNLGGSGGPGQIPRMPNLPP